MLWLTLLTVRLFTDVSDCRWLLCAWLHGDVLLEQPVFAFQDGQMKGMGKEYIERKAGIKKKNKWLRDDDSKWFTPRN
jgi:hypothetical protein